MRFKNGLEMKKSIQQIYPLHQNPSNPYESTNEFKKSIKYYLAVIALGLNLSAVNSCNIRYVDSYLTSAGIRMAGRLLKK